MKRPFLLLPLLHFLVVGPWLKAADSREIPGPLKEWATWATWDDVHRECPTPYSDSAQHRCFWPSALAVDAGAGGGRFRLEVTVFHSTWLPLPGGTGSWPEAVRTGEGPVAVVEHEGVPSVRLGAGSHVVEGGWKWETLPQRLPVPSTIGILELAIGGNRVETPAWDPQGGVWLRREGRAGSAEKDFLAVQVSSVLEDGIPVWLRREIELTVSGSSREVQLGTILPEGWRLASVDGPVPVAVDDAGRMKAQVRAGKWTIRVDAFRLDDPGEIRYPAGVQPLAEQEWIGFRARPDLRVAELTGASSVDVSQTTFPAKWRDLPVYRWETGQGIRLEERLRGMGDQTPGGLSMVREWWLDEDGGGLTFRDRLTGGMQQVWRLDAAEGVELGSVRSGGEGQLITRSPRTGAAGVEIRTRNVDLEATGRMGRGSGLPATGWRSDAESVHVTVHLPPGWRLLALTGADWVAGDWLTAWTLLDLFVLLIVSLTLFRLGGIGAALLGFVALGLSYHEPGAPRYLWLALLAPAALERVVPAGRPRHWVVAGKYAVLAVLGLFLVPFLARQVQQAIYPQLEVVRRTPMRAPAGFPSAPGDAAPPARYALSNDPDFYRREEAKAAEYGLSRAAAAKLANRPVVQNLLNDPKARIQTGPAVPEWSWRTVGFGWNGPVQATQQVRPILIPMSVERLLSVLRVGLLLALVGGLVRLRRRVDTDGAGGRMVAGVGVSAVFVLLFLGGGRVRADDVRIPPGDGTVVGAIPDPAILATLRQRLLKASDAFPNAADIPRVSLRLEERRLRIEAEIHTAVQTAVPLPGRLPAWMPVRVEVDGRPGAVLRRDDGFLWIVLPPGVHRVRVDGGLPEASEWEWTFLLRPRRVEITAPGWTVRGVGSDGVPEQQVFFTAEQRVTAGDASYERQEVQAVARVERHLELGLRWQVRTVVNRLSPPGRAIALRIPLLPGENVLSEEAVVRDGMMEVRLGAQDSAFSWEGDLTSGAGIELATRPDDGWVERWHVVVSPVWNLTFTGLGPVFQGERSDLVPVWHPWPGESARLELLRPEALAGATMTVGRVSHGVQVGRRQRVASLDLSVRSSLGEDFVMELPEGAEVTSLQHDGQAVPVRRDGRKLIVPVRPGEQALAVGWKLNGEVGARAEPGEVRLPVEAANVGTVLEVPESRWVLWTSGPRRGPAVRFWVILACALLAAVLLARPRLSPLRLVEWLLLGVGLTQVPLPAAAVVVVWLWVLAWRGLARCGKWTPVRYNLMQAGLVLLTVGALAILVTAVGEGLLGSPEMFITGNGSTRTRLNWFQDRTPGLLSQPSYVAVSIWWYRLLMLVWALWLAMSLIRWLGVGWRNFSIGGVIRRGVRVPPGPPAPPPMPASAP